jgi:hypothetical protein
MSWEEVHVLINEEEKKGKRVAKAKKKYIYIDARPK